jgi:hypothetical protein
MAQGVSSCDDSLRQSQEQRLFAVVILKTIASAAFG